MNIEAIKNWAKRHKKGIILAVGSTMAVTIGAKMLYDNYYFVTTKSDMVTIAKGSVFLPNVSEMMKQLGDVDRIWENAESINALIGCVPWSQLGEAGKVFCDNFHIDERGSAGIVFSGRK